MEVPVKSNPGDEISNDLKKKIALLKKAILKEREEKQKDLEDIENFKRRISVSEIQLSEKNSQVQIMAADKEKVEKEVGKLKEQIKTYSNPATAQGGKKSMANLEQLNKKLLEEYHFLKQQNVDLKNMISALAQEQVEKRGKIESKNEYINKIKADSEAKIKLLKKQQDDLEKELSNSKSSLVSLSDTQNKLKIELESLITSQKSLDEELLTLNHQLLMKQGNIASLKERLLKLSENESALSSRLMDYKNELVEAESYYQKHQVTKINQILNHPANIVLKHNYNGDYILEIEEEKKDKIIYELRNISEVAKNPNSEKRFWIKTCDACTFDFDCNNAEEIVRKINEFISRTNNN